MVPARAKVGMKVLIEKINTTQKRHGINSNMREMVGKKYTIKEIRKTGKIPHGVAIYIRGIGHRGYTWAPEDLQIPLIKNIKGGKFNPNNLIY